MAKKLDQAEPAKTTTAELKELAIRPGDDATSIGLNDGRSFALAQRVATMLSQSDLVPQRYQGKVGNCVIALNMAHRIGADPLMVMQSLYVVHGTPAWSAQFLIACFNHCGRFSSLRYEFKGAEGSDEWGCRAWAVEKETGERLDGPWITIGLAKKSGWYNKPDKYGKESSKWPVMPQQMLMYRSAAWFVRAYAPEIAMGLQTAEEVRDTYDMEPGESGAFTLGALRSEVDATAPSQETPTDLIECKRDEAMVSKSKVCSGCQDKGTCPEFKAAA
jgi:hypothetical protein